MLTLQKKHNKTIISVPAENQSIELLLKKQWLLTNGRGGYASSTVAGCNTSSYHGLLIGALDPPVRRVMALSNCLDMIICSGKVFNLSTFEFPDKFAPEGFTLLKEFHKDTGAHFFYELDDNESNCRLKITKSIYLLRDQDTAAIVYDFADISSPVEFVCRPFAGLRDLHSIQKSSAHLHSNPADQGVSVRYESPESCELLLTCPSAKFVKDPQWWFNFVYRDNRERGLNHAEDLWTPGFFKCRIDEPTQVVIWASLLPSQQSSISKVPTYTDVKAVQRDLQEHNKNLLEGIQRNSDAASKSDSDICDVLALAADQFIVKRNTQNTSRTTIIAGYPWFMDWGRDAFISLPGLLLATGRLDEAKSVLTTFASALDEGMIPSRFDDDTNTACFNSVDASLWFIVASFQYLKASDDSKTFTEVLIPAIEGIINAYQKGTRFDIHADSDGLISAGSEQTQLTWMDAKYDGITFTPRYGKPVEVNALWYNCLCLMTKFYERRDNKKAQRFESVAKQVTTSFSKLFWNEEKNYLNDCVTLEGKIDDSLRPNQIYAVSLEYSPLTEEQQKSVVKVVQENLLTPCGLRTLNTSAPNYIGLYTGPQRQRDEAYHQGTVWPFLMGPFIDAYLKVNHLSEESKKAAMEMIQPLLRHLTEDSCLGNISEIFDGDPPHNPKGCFAQAWSVGELIRVYKLLNS